MELNVGKEIAVLKRMTVGELRERYAEVFGEETHARNKQWLVKRVIWRLQSMSEGNLSERARTRAAELANDADLRRRPPKQLSATTRPVAHEATAVDGSDLLVLPTSRRRIEGASELRSRCDIDR